MGRRRKHGREALDELVDAIESHCTAQMSDGWSEDSVATWGASLSIGELISVLTTNGRREFSGGHIVVPDGIRMQSRQLHGHDVIRHTLTNGPYFEGRRLTKVIDFLKGKAVITHIDLSCDNTRGKLGLDNMFDMPFSIEWG